MSVIQDPGIRSLATMVLEGAGHRVVEAGKQQQAESLLGNGLSPDFVLWEGNSLDSSNQLRHLSSFISADRICVISGIGEQWMRNAAAGLGVRHVVAKPVTRENLEALMDAVSPESQDCVSDLSSAAVCTENTQKAGNPVDMPAVPYVEELGGNSFFLAASPQMLEIHRQIILLADIDVNVLILGESGTGKEVVAQLIHKNSRRCRERFLKVNCAALPTDLLESELFGHRQGAFTGAINDRAGKFEQVNRGTLLLDEIAEIGVPMQAKLLHVLQDGQFARLGAQETTKVDVRVLAATNVEIEDAMFEKTFREDLYYRLSVFTIKVPPLRERREEIPYLIEQMIRRAPDEMTKGFGANLPSRLMDAALLYDWRGNVRELRNFVTRTIIMRNPDAAAKELEEKIAAAAVESSRHEDADLALPCAGIRSVVRDVKDRTEVEMLQSALDAFGWNRRRAAQYLGISYRALLYKIQQHRLSPLPAPDPLRLFQGTRSGRKNAVQRVGPGASLS
ncbi:MAG: sigma-54 dependent transcriptional regulator [Terracidiphilus sp.]